MTIYNKPKGISRKSEDVEGDKKKAERFEKKINKKLIHAEQVAIEFGKMKSSKSKVESSRLTKFLPRKNNIRFRKKSSK